MKNKSKYYDSSVEVSSKLKDSEHINLLALFDNSTIGMVICKLNGQFLKVNDQFAKISGYSKEELYTMSFKEITYPDDLDSDLELVNELFEGKRKNFQLEKRYITKDKRIVC